jgi:hypothetical protein
LKCLPRLSSEWLFLRESFGVLVWSSKPLPGGFFGPSEVFKGKPPRLHQFQTERRESIYGALEDDDPDVREKAIMANPKKLVSNFEENYITH